MADHTGPRCTRRKQANPRRKNVELEDMPEEVDLDHLGPNDMVSKETVTKETEDPEESLLTNTSQQVNNNNGASKEGFHSPCQGNSAKLTDCTKANVPSHVDEDDDEENEGDDGGGANGEVDGEGDDKKGEENSILPGQARRSEEDLQSEEEKIQEYLKRSDTAVIYPEPVDGYTTNQPSSTQDDAASEAKTTVDKEFFLKCPHCDKAFPGIDALRGHLVTQHGAAEQSVDGTGYSCDKCSATFALKEQLEKHELLHSPTAQVVACKVCNKTFANVYRLQRHMISHDESAVLRKFKCPECEKAFKFKHHLKEHIRIHSGEKPFACPNCGKRFSHSGSYSSHMTSKKCLVMNLKVRRTIDKPIRNGGGRRSTQGAFTPILPKYGENGVELTSPTYGGGIASAASMSPEHFAIDFSHHPMQQFLPPYASLPLHPLMTANHFQNSGLSPYGLPPPLADLSHMIRPSAMAAKQLEDSKELSPDKYPPLTEPRPRSCSPLKCEDEIKLEKCNSLSPGLPSACGDLNAVKKILATVNATVSRQQLEVNKLKNGLLPHEMPQLSPSPLSGRDEAHSPLRNSLSPKPNLPFVEPKRNGLKGDDSHCRFCGDYFESKIDLHQHERYLCKLNKDIYPPLVGNNEKELKSSDEIKTEPGERSRTMCHTNGSIGEGGEDEMNSEDDDSNRDPNDDEVVIGDGRKVRVRSLISEETLMVLRSHYVVNPRPKKDELQRIAQEINFPTRVVQVWFQNMRARDRKRGRTIQVPYYPSSNMEGGSVHSTSSPPSVMPLKAFPAITSSPYAPVIPPFNGVIPSRLPMPLFYPAPSPTQFPLHSTPLRINGQCTSPSFTPSVSLVPPFTDHDQPLDLSLKRKARTLCPSPGSDTADYEVLNLSQKSSRTSTPSKESNNNNCVLSSGLLHPSNNNNNLPKGECKLETSALYKYMQREGLILAGSTGHHPVSLTPSSGGGVITRLESSDPNPALRQDDGELDLRTAEPKPSSPSCENSRLHQILAASTPTEHPMNGAVDSSGHVYSTDGSRSPPYPSDGEDQLEIDESTGEHVKIMAKRTWKQADGEESQPDMDDSSVGEDDRPLKRRKSWKQHKVDAEEGMYACDQCDKMFSKQSSLARHKYEHSGQRPHKCDVCGKAFKHKHHLTEHKRLHSGEKPFQCKKCLKRFSHSGSYSQHMNHRYSYCKPYRE